MSTTFRMSTKNVLAPEIVVNNDRIPKKVFTFHNCIIFPRKKNISKKCDFPKNGVQLLPFRMSTGRNEI